MPHTEKTCYERTRLHFIVYVCDHHCSLSHGRPPLTRDTKILKSPRALLDSDFSSPSDLNLVSQVELWSISTQIFDQFGAATDSALIHSRLAELEEFSETYESWRHKWTEKLKGTPGSDQGAQTMLDMCFHSARLSLFSHLFRGSAQDLSRPQNSLKTINRFAITAAQSALCIVQNMTEMSEAHACPDLPSYFYTMLAFASVFLLKGPWRVLDEALQERALQQLNRLVGLCSGPLDITHAVHPISSIVSGLRTAIGGQLYGKLGNGGNEVDNLTYRDPNPPDMADEGLVMNDAENTLAPLVFPNDIGLDIPDFDIFDFSYVG